MASEDSVVIVSAVRTAIGEVLFLRCLNGHEIDNSAVFAQAPFWAPFQSYQAISWDLRSYRRLSREVTSRLKTSPRSSWVR